MTMNPDALEVAQIEQQIAALQRRKAQLQGQAPPDGTVIEGERMPQKE